MHHVNNEIDISASTAYDDAFRTMISFCVRLLIPVVNEVFGTNYDENATIAVHNNEHYINYGKGMQDKLVTDSYFTINGDTYILECQSTRDGRMIIRIFGYAIQVALENADFFSNDTLEITLPRVAVLYLRSNRNTPDVMNIKVRTPEGDYLSFQAPTIKMKDYTLDSIFEKKLYFLLPFFVFNREKEFQIYESDPSKLEELKQEYVEIFNRLEQTRMNGDLSEFYVGTILDMSQRVFDKIADNYENIRKGVASIMGGRILEYPTKTVYDGAINDERHRMAVDMLKSKRFSRADIVQFSKLSEDVVDSIEKSLALGLA